MSAVTEVEALIARLEPSGASRKLRVASRNDDVPLLPLEWPGLNEVLPDRGLPRGVVELSAPRALGGATSIALAAVRAGLARGQSAWCAWVDPEATLYAPGVFAAGVDLARMLVVRAPRANFARAAVKLVASGAFEVVVVDVDPVPDASAPPEGVESQRLSALRRRPIKPEVFVRKLALAAEPSGATVLLLTDACVPRATAWPVALRLELTRPSRDDLTVRVAKDRRGRVGLAKTIPFHPVTRLLRAAG
ncbi:MAG: recombinase A [Polyangiaceae bacterium]|nr:recombinase A [Polyangiaceae bacterium]